MKDGPPLLLWYQIHKVFRVAEAARVGPVVRPACLRNDSLDLGEGRKDEAPLIRKPLALSQARAIRQRTSRPDRALVEMRQKLRTDNATQGKKESNCKRPRANANGNPSMLNRPLKPMPVAVLQELH